MLHLCSGDQAVLPKPALQTGTHSLLNTMGVDDVMGDAPKAADWVRAAALCSHLHGSVHLPRVY